MNTSDTPVYFKLLQDLSGTFQIFPTMGLIQGQSFMLITISFNPRSAKLWSFTSQAVFNHQATSVQNLHFTGECYNPEVTIGNKGKLFFPPTYPGVSSKQKLSIKNNGRVPIEYEMQAPDKYKEAIIFDPSKLILQANEEVRMVCQFTPAKKKEYQFSVPMHVKSITD